MKAIIDSKTLEALDYYGDASVQEFYKRLKNKQFCTTRCKDCSDAAFPPRNFCPSCHSRNVEWFDMPTRGKLYAKLKKHQKGKKQKNNQIKRINQCQLELHY